ncbi:MAG: SpoIVB peptidase [Prevotella sp.]|nr:SpoIVB peptidase [Staphylococcus sp.]MCM1349769.1 SpoIVB peptidase [Prevotella sp.]
MKKISKLFSFLLVFLIFTSIFYVKADSKTYVYLGGDSIGIKMETGVYVVGKYQVQTKEGKVSPWKHTNVEIGDRIESINGIKIENNQQLQAFLQNRSQQELKLLLVRKNEKIQTSILPIENTNHEQSIGLYIRDQVLGIGTLTFITKDAKFGSLGHGVYDNKTLLETLAGNLYYSTVQTIKKSEVGTAGEKRASINTQKIGKIIKNDITGLYGKLDTWNSSKKEIEVAHQDEIELGKAQLYTVVENQQIVAYDVEVVSVQLQTKKDVKGIKIKITDPDLIQKTGGIVQGMSGSPIVQNGKLIGAVSHVTVENPVYGYAMHIEWMIQESTRLE